MLPAKTLEKIASSIGVSTSELLNMDPEALDQLIELKIGKKLTFKSHFGTLSSRGNILIFMEKFLSRERISQKFDTLFANG